MTFLEAVNSALRDSMREKHVLLLGQLVKYGLGGLTEGLYEQAPSQVITFPVCENLMHGAAMGLSLAGYVPVVVNERMDFMALAMDPILNHIAVWPKRAPISLPLVMVAVVGKGKGQGPQHSKNFTPWFRSMEGIKVVEPDYPERAYWDLRDAISGREPVLYVLHREFFSAEGKVALPAPTRVGLCGASAEFERKFYSSSGLQEL